MARNCHKAVYHGVYLNKLETEYLFPRKLEGWGIDGGIAQSDVENALSRQSKPEAGGQFRAVVITSPTYEGVVSDIEAIAACCHKYGVPLIVDEAHGGHFGLGKGAPESAVTKGADLVIQSLHKTMPALTQTALLHVCGKLADRERIARFSAIYQTSSPSYLLMGSIEQCISMMEEQKDKLFELYVQRVTACRKRLESCKNIRLFSPSQEEKRRAACYETDTGRFVFSVHDFQYQSQQHMSGNDLMDRLRKKYSLELEMAGQDYVTAIVTVMDSEEGLERLCRAIEELDGQLQRTEEKETTPRFRNGSQREQEPVPKVIMSIAEAYDGQWEACPLPDTAGRTAAEFVYIYPPGIPILAPGEMIGKEHLHQIREAQDQGLSVEGPADMTLACLRVVPRL